jgi:urease accessory protein
MKAPLRPAIVLAALAAASPALAHPGHGGDALAGFTHPFTGADHLAAMLLVGLWAAMRGGEAVVAWPAAFAASVLGGYALANGHALPFVEPAVMASVIGLGALVAADARVATPPGVALIALAGLAHGMAHGAEAPAAALGFPAGMSAATVLLHLIGLGLGLGLKRLCKPAGVRLLGAGAAMGGVALAVLG